MTQVLRPSDGESSTPDWRVTEADREGDASQDLMFDFSRENSSVGESRGKLGTNKLIWTKDDCEWLISWLYTAEKRDCEHQLRQ